MRIFIVACKFIMTLPAIYISIHLLTIILLFIKGKWSDKYKMTLILVHLVLLSFLLLDIFVFNLRGVLPERLVMVAFLLSASTIYALYRQTLKLWQRMYFGFFLFYPIIAAATFFLDRILFVIVASPLLVTLTVPETKFSSNEYDLREIVGAIAPVQLALIKNGLITEKNLGTSNNEQITNKDITGLTIIRITGDTTIALVKLRDNNFEIAFHK